MNIQPITSTPGANCTNENVPLEKRRFLNMYPAGYPSTNRRIFVTRSGEDSDSIKEVLVTKI